MSLMLYNINTNGPSLWGSSFVKTVNRKANTGNKEFNYKRSKNRLIGGNERKKYGALAMNCSPK